MVVRKTKQVWLFKTANAQRIYESKSDMLEDVRLCEEVAGVAPQFDVEEVTCVMACDVPVPDAIPEPPRRTRVDYSQEFEAYWVDVPVKRKKAETYKSWLENNHGSTAPVVTP